MAPKQLHFAISIIEKILKGHMTLDHGIGV